MQFVETKIQGVFEIHLDAHSDARGGFGRAYCENEFQKAGVPNFRPVQANLSWNTQEYTLRGLHYQHPPHAEEKLVRVVHGRAYDVVLDLREDSSTYLEWVAIELDWQKRNAVFIPVGCAHGFLTLAPNTELLYIMGSFFQPGYDQGVRWDDPRFGIAWPHVPTVVSHRDAHYRNYQPASK